MRREPVYAPNLRDLGLDVHADTSAVAVAEPDGEVRFLGIVFLWQISRESQADPGSQPA
jgi:hypothetical protein